MNQSEAVGVAGESPVRADRRERWRALVEEQRQSGMSVSVFCRERSIPPSSFFAWRRKLDTRPKVRPVVAPDGDAGFAAGFTRVKLLQETAAVAPAESGLELRLPGDRRVIVRRGFDRDLLIELMRTLGELA